MKTPCIIKACASCQIDGINIAEKLGGSWLAKNLLGVPGPSGSTVFNDLELAKNLCGTKPLILINLYNKLYQLFPEFLARLPITNDGFWRNKDLLAAFLPMDANVSDLEAPIFSEIRLGEPKKKKFFVFNKLQKTDLLFTEVLRNEFLIAYAIHNRVEYGLNLTMLIRITKILLSQGLLQPQALRSSCSVFGKFCLAAANLAIRGFKSKRNKPVTLLPGTPVKHWYESGHNIKQIRSVSVAGHIVSVTNGVARVSSMTDGVLSYRYGAEGEYAIWPMI